MFEACPPFLNKVIETAKGLFPHWDLLMAIMLRIKKEIITLLLHEVWCAAVTMNSYSILWCLQRPASPHWGPLVWTDAQSHLPSSWPSGQDKYLPLALTVATHPWLPPSKKKVLLTQDKDFCIFIIFRKDRKKKGWTSPKEGVSQLQWETRKGSLWPPVTCTACSVSGSHHSSLVP